MTRRVYRMNGESFVFKSEHPLEERITVLTDDYRGSDGEFILPEPVAWDGVESNPGVYIVPVHDDEEGILE